MCRIAYVNGRYLPFRDAKVHVEDRGYQFADSVYEVCEVRGGRLIDERRHMTRLARSLAELRIPMPMSPRALGVVLRELVARNRIGYGVVYLQISRGVARRDPAFPSPQTAPTVVATARPLNRARNEALAEKGISVVSVPDNRWGRVDIKTVGLLPNVLARQSGDRQGRARRLVRRQGRQGHRSRLRQCLDRHAGRHAGHPACRSRHPARHHPRRHLRRRQGAGPDRGGARLHAGRGLCARGRPSRPRRPRS